MQSRTTIQVRNNADVFPMQKPIYGPEIDGPVRMNRNGTNYYYHAAALGTVTEITSTNGTLLERYTYDVYGEPKMWDGSGSAIASSQVGNRLMFQGRDRDADTGLYNFRHRNYSASLGRFVQVDLIRIAGGLNLYGFVRNNPTRLQDAFGLSFCVQNVIGPPGLKQPR